MPDQRSALDLRLEMTLTQLEKQVKHSNAIIDKSANGMANSYARANRRTQRGFRQTANAARGMSRTNRFIIQNTANQFGDMAVQLEQGTNAMRVMGQQVPQLLGAFGPVGSILGTVAAIGFPVAAAMQVMGDSQDKTAKSADELAEAVGRAKTAINSANSAIKLSAEGDLKAIEKAYGSVTQEVLDLVGAIAKLETSQAIKAAGEAISGTFNVGTGDNTFFQAMEKRSEAIKAVESEIANLEARNFPYDNTQGEEANRLMESLVGDLKVWQSLDGIANKFEVEPTTVQDILILEKAINNALAANNLPGLLENVTKLRVLLQEVPDGPLREMGDKLVEAQDLLTRANATANSLKPSLDAAADGFVSDVKKAETGLVRIKQLLNDEDLLSAQIVVKPVITDTSAIDDFNDKYRTQGLVGGGRGADPRDVNQPGTPFVFDSSAQKKAETEAKKAARDAERSAQELRREGLAAIEAQYTAEERRIAQLKEVIELRSKVVETFGAEDALIPPLDEAIKRMEKMATAATQVTDILNEGISQAALEAENLGDLLDIAATSARKILATGLEQILTGARNGSAPSGIGGFFSGLFDKIPKFARGTNFAPGGPSIVGEDGPELVNLSRGAQVVPNGAFGAPNVSFNINVAGATDPMGTVDALKRVLIPEMKAIARGETQNRNRRLGV